MKQNIGVIFGGNSTEHEISIISALQAIESIDKEKYNVIPIYLSKDSIMYTGDYLFKIENYKDLKKVINNSTEVLLTKKDHEFVLIKKKFPYKIINKIDLAFPIVHGYNIEDGSLAGYLEVLGIPFCESDIYASVIGQDKVYQKGVFKADDIPVVDYIYFYESDYENDEKNIIKSAEKLGYPLIIKPARQGSSVGIKIAKNQSELKNAIEEALTYDEKILIEKVIEDLCELNASVLGDNALFEVGEIEEVTKGDEILSYTDKYMSNGAKKTGSKGMASAGRKIPADIPEEIRKQIEEYSIKACHALNANGVVRIDYLYDTKHKKVYLNEVNIIPGSLSFYLWSPKDLNYTNLLNKIIALGIKRYQNKSKKLSSFETNVLSTFNGTKGIKK